MEVENKRTFAPFVLAGCVVTFLLGGTVTIGGITIQNPWQDDIRNALIADEYVFKRMKSFHAITAVLTVIEDKGRLLKQL